MTDPSIVPGASPERMAQPLGALQCERARLLADAHSHHWPGALGHLTRYAPPTMEGEEGEEGALLDELPAMALDPPPSVAAIHERVTLAHARELYTYGPAGCTGLWQSAEGVLRHRTASGRLTWAVHPDGHTVLTVWRPRAEGNPPPVPYPLGEGVPVLRANVQPGGGLELALDLGGEACPAFPRHFQVLVRALDVLGVEVPEGLAARAAEEDSDGG